MDRSLVDWDYWLNRWPGRPVSYVRANQADAKPFALTPLSQDLVLEYEADAGLRFYRDVVGVRDAMRFSGQTMAAFYGLIYLNADTIGDLADATPGHSRAAAYEQFYGLRRDPSYRPPRKPASEAVREAAAALPVLPRMLRAASRLPALIRNEHRRILAARPAGGAGPPDDADDAELERWCGRLDALAGDAWLPLMIGAGCSGAIFEVLRKLLAKLAADPDGDLANRLHVGLGGNESAEVAREVRRLAALAREEPAAMAALRSDDPHRAIEALGGRFAAALRVALDRFGYRGAVELELARPSWRADPNQLLRAVLMEAGSPRSPDGSDRVREEAERDLARRANRAARAAIAPVLSRSRRLMSLRENGKTPIARLYDERRRLLEAAAPRLARRGAIPDADAVDFLRHAELHDVLRGGSGPGSEEIERRRDAYRRCLELELPDHLEVGPGWLRPIPEGAFRSMGLLPPEVPADDATRLEGIPAAPGVVTGIARVVRDPYRDQFEPGEVLFAHTVDPGWSPVLGCAGAIVLDVGGSLSHGAVVARELGIPCVVNVRSGTSLARSGSTVTVDGSRGEVILGAPEPSVKLRT